MSDEKQICKYCWIEVKKMPEMKTILHGEPRGDYIHKSLQNDVGNPFCGRQFLTEDDIEVVTEVSEA